MKTALGQLLYILSIVYDISRYQYFATSKSRKNMPYNRIVFMLRQFFEDLRKYIVVNL